MKVFKSAIFIIILFVCIILVLSKFRNSKPHPKERASNSEGGSTKFSYRIDDDNLIEITGYNGYSCSVKIPGSINGIPVYSIGESAFVSCIWVTNFTIPNGVKIIGKNAFWGCSSAIEIKIPNSVTTIKEEALALCVKLKRINLTGVTEVGEKAFYMCSGLEFVQFGDDLDYIGDEAFYGCSNLSNVYFKGESPEFGKNVFWNTPIIVRYNHENTPKINEATSVP